MKDVDRFRVPLASAVKLAEIDPGFKGHHEGHKDAAKELERDQQKLRMLHDPAKQRKISREHASWFVIPSDHKWFRNLAIARIVVEYLEGLGLKYPRPSVDLERIRREYHAAGKA